MNRKQRRAEEAKSRQGQQVELANPSATTVQKIRSAETTTVIDMLKGEVTPEKVDAVMENAFEYAAMFNNPRAPIACGSGCYYCCYQKVATTGLELVYIMKWLQENKTEEERTKYLADLQEVAKKRPPTESQAERCPFLGAANECTIYEVRPLACRSVVSRESEPCRSWLEDGTKVGKVSDPKRYQAHHAVLNGVDEGTNAHGLHGGFLDFHGSMALLLADPDKIKRWYEGEHIFSSTNIPPRLRRLPML